MIVPDFRNFKHQSELYHYGIPRRSGRYPWGSGDRPYQSVSSSALSIYKFANEKEKAITNDVKEAAKISNCKLYGLENRLKTIDSIQRKINKKQIEDGKTEKESMVGIHDSVRYTTISENKDFVQNYETFKRNMNDRGYTEIECKNYYDLFNKGIVKHKAVQSKFSTRDGFIFEVQFQTPESQDAKTKKIPLYEERRKVGIDAKRAKVLEDEMEKLALKVPNPPGIEKIKSHSSPSSNISSNDKLKEIKKKDSFGGIDVYYWDKNLKHSIDLESEVKFKMNSIYYLSHGGPGSGRYPLGSGDRPYQKFEGSKKRTSSISDYIKSRKAKKVEEKQKKQQAEENRKRLEYEEMKKRHDADKERVLKKGTATEVLRYQGELTNQELQNAFNRINLESQLKNLSQREVKTAMDKFDKVMKTVKTGTEWVKIATDTYNTIAAIYNATPEGKKNKLTIISKGDGNKKKS